MIIELKNKLRYKVEKRVYIRFSVVVKGLKQLI